MNKKDLIQDVCYKTKMTKKEIDVVLTSILEVVIDKVSEGERVRLVGFGSFYAHKKKCTAGSLTSNSIPQKSTIKFSPGKFFKQKINNTSSRV